MSAEASNHMVDTDVENSGIADTDIAIVGMALRVPGADDVESFWSCLKAGQELIHRFSDAELEAAGVDAVTRANPRYVKAKAVLSGASDFDAPLFGLSAREAALLDPQHRLFLECAWTALEHAGCTPAGMHGHIGVYAGAGASLYLLRHLLGNPEASEMASWFEIMLANSGDSLPTRASYLLDLRGPSVNVQTACSTSLVAVHLAAQALLNGECNAALAGGVSLDLPEGQGYWYQEGMILSPDGHCRPFDAEARGTVPGSGVGVVVLKRLADALADGDTVHAVIMGSAINNDGRDKVGFTAPSTDGQAAVIREALQMAGVEAARIGYVEAHGTATPLGDPIEVAALDQAFGDRPGGCALGSVKSNLGHLNTAAGVVGLIKAALCVRDGLIPPTLHFERPNPQLALEQTPFHVVRQLEAWTDEPRHAGVSSFGIGGTNAHVVLRQAPATPATRPPAFAEPLVLPLSARTPTALERLAEDLAAHLEAWPHLDFRDVAFTLQHGRRALEARRAVVCSSLQEAVTGLRSPESTPSGEGAAHALAARWCAGETPAWPPLGRRVPLPGYPFERQRCWISPPRTAAHADAEDPKHDDELPLPPRMPDLADWFFVPAWHELPPSPRAALPGCVLLLADPHGLCGALARMLTREGVTVAMAHPGEGFARTGALQYSIRPAATDDYKALLAALDDAGQRPAAIVHALALPADRASVPAPDALLDALDGRLELGVHALLALVQALAQRSASECHHLLVGLGHALEIVDDGSLQPDQATLLGAAKIVSQEHDNIACRAIDVGAADLPDGVEALWRELQDTGPDVAVHRGGRRWVEHYQPAPVPPRGLETRLGPNGHYLITGGLGGMGLAFAEALAELGPCRLILIGRSVFPAEEDWDEWLREHGQADGDGRRVAETIRRLRAIQARACSLRVYAADVADASRMREVLAEARGAFGPLTGVLHAAGVADYEGVIRARSRAQTKRTIAAKVHGTLILDALTRDDPLDVFLMCSSLGTVLYHIKFGQVGYAIANEFIDQYARARRARGGRGFTVAINWSDWRESGMSVAALRRWAERHKLSEIAPDEEGLSDAEGRAVMLRALMQDAPRVAIAQHDLRELIRQDPLRARRIVSDAETTVARPGLDKPYVAPRDEIERRVSAAWQKLLGIERVGAEDDFYELGGHSLLATQLVARINDALSVEVPLDDFLDEPTVAAMATLVRQARTSARDDRPATTTAAIPRSLEQGPRPLSFAQQRLWFLHQLEPNPASYNMPMALRLEGELDHDALARSLAAVVARHESQRTLFTETDGVPHQTVQPATAWSFDEIDMRHLDAKAAEAAALDEAQTEAGRPFDLTRDFPLRVRLLRLGPRSHMLLLTQHHIASDGWSVGVLLRELGTFYAAYARGEPAPLAPLPIQYADFAAWQRTQLDGERLEEELDWWLEQVEDTPDLQLPTDLPRPDERSGQGALIGAPLSAALCCRLDEFGRGENATRYMLLLAAFQVLLQRYSGQDDFAVGTPIANRTRPELETLIGFFANTLVMRAHLQDDPSYRELVRRARSTALGAFAHQQLPFEKLVEALDAGGELGRTPLFQVLFVLQNAASEPLRLPGVDVSPLHRDNATAKFDLTLSVIPDGDGLHALFEYSTDLFHAETITTFASQYAQLLANLLDAPDDPVATVSLESSQDMPAL